jgi:hypothetical protein
MRRIIHHRMHGQSERPQGIGRFSPIHDWGKAVARSRQKLASAPLIVKSSNKSVSALWRNCFNFAPTADSGLFSSEPLNSAR